MSGRSDVAAAVSSGRLVRGWYGVAAGPALAYALGLQALQLAVGIVAGLAALGGHGLTLSELAGRSKQAAAALRGAEARVSPAEEPAGG